MIFWFKIHKFSCPVALRYDSIFRTLLLINPQVLLKIMFVKGFENNGIATGWTFRLRESAQGLVRDFQSSPSSKQGLHEFMA